MRKPENSNKLWYRCMDGGKIVEVDPICRFESRHVRYHVSEIEEENKMAPDPCEIAQWKSWMNEDQKFGCYPISVRITSKILSKVNNFCVARYEIYNKHFSDVSANRMIDDLIAFDCKFLIGSSLTHLFQLMDAADELMITSLFDLTIDAIVDKLAVKS